MSTKKQPKNLKTAKKVIKPIEIEDGTKTEIITPTDDELVLGVEKTTKEIKVVDYTSKNKKYLVYITANGRKMTANGREISTFIGTNNQARQALKNGAKSVDIEDEKANIIYKIEVL